jgi:exo-1,4-beta-D-glucosaminidase
MARECPQAGRSRIAPAASALFLAVLAGACGGTAERAAEPAAETSIALAEGWSLRSSEGLAAGGAELSRPGYAAAGWTPAAVPSTVLAALVASGEVPDPYAGRNLEAIDEARFTVPWWYRNEFDLHGSLPESARLVFEGINYSAEIWLNGERIAGSDEVAGAYRVFDLDVTPHLVAGRNALAVEVHPPRPGDPTIGFVDWNPKPPDRNLGLWRGVTLRWTGAVSLDDLHVRSDLDLRTLATAYLSLGGSLTNHSARPVDAVLRGRIGDVALEHRVALEPGETRALRLTAAELPQLRFESPRLWWPQPLGEPHLYRLDLGVEVDGRVSDRHEVDFGIRHVADYLTPEGHRGYTVNGKPVLVRGGGWVDDLLLADDSRRLEDQIRYVRHLGLNTIRLEGFWGSSHELFDLADRYGIMVWAGWSCQWEWENYFGQPVDEKFGGIDTPAEMDLITRSLHDQVVWLRNHPSVVVWNLASDMLPRPELERRYREMLAVIDPTRPPLAACSTRTSEVSGPTGVKMNGPYDWVPPNYWYLDGERGGAFGFNTETGPGPQPPPLGSLERMLPPEHRWPIDETWSYRAARGQFSDIDLYAEALAARYGEPAGIEDFAEKAQLANYEAMRAMFEAFSLRRPRTTGVIQWMLNGAWPKIVWQLYDWYLVPNGAFYGARIANRPLHVAYDLGTREVIAVNDGGEAVTAAEARVRVFDLESEVAFDESRPLELAAETRGEVLALPAAVGGGGPVFLDLRITGADGALLASNLYWLPAEPDVLDWEASEWYVTPVERFADLTAFTRLPPATLEVEHRFAPAADGDGREIVVTIANPGEHLAFFVELAVVGGESGRLAAPIYWDDNYVSLVPGERREIRGTFPAHALAGGETPVFRYSGINVEGR